jgi:2-keto-3-deoxy-L-rhamnonate aldolase RhmA
MGKALITLNTHRKANIMATDKQFTVAGVSKLDGEYKVRFANDVLRIKVLAKHGHEDITLVELPSAMSKVDAVKFIKGLDEFAGASEQSAIADYLDRKDEKPAKATATKAPAKAKAAPKATAKVADTSAMEDAPF